MDRFGFFFAFYRLILGLAVAELLSGFAGMVRAHALRAVDRIVMHFFGYG